MRPPLPLVAQGVERDPYESHQEEAMDEDVDEQ